MMELKKSDTPHNYTIHTRMDVRLVAELMKALMGNDDLYHPSTNSELARGALEALHEWLVPMKMRGMMSTEASYLYLASLGFKVPMSSTVEGTKDLRSLAKEAAKDNVKMEDAAQSTEAKEIAAAFLEGGETE